MIREPGIYPNIPDDVYHGDRDSLSVSAAKLLLPPSAPAIFRHYQMFGRPNKPEFDEGHAIHQLVLGTGPELVEVEADDWRKNATKEMREKIYIDGKVPLLSKDFQRVHRIAAQVKASEAVRELMSVGSAEQSLYCVHDSGVRMRGRVDWLRWDGFGSAVTIVDLKSANSASPRAFAADAAKYKYAMQEAWYTALARALGLEVVAFKFVVVAKSAPYPVVAYELDEPSKELGCTQMRQAIDIYNRCMESGRWPGFEAQTIGLPPWAFWDDTAVSHQSQDVEAEEVW